MKAKAPKVRWTVVGGAIVAGVVIAAAAAWLRPLTSAQAQCGMDMGAAGGGHGGRAGDSGKGAMGPMAGGGCPMMSGGMPCRVNEDGTMVLAGKVKKVDASEGKLLLDAGGCTMTIGLDSKVLKESNEALKPGETVTVTAALVARSVSRGDHLTGSTTTFKVSGMMCEACADAIRTALMKTDGVVSADVSFEAKRAVVTFDPAKIDESGVKRAIEKAPHPHAGERFKVVGVDKGRPSRAAGRHGPSCGDHGPGGCGMQGPKTTPTRESVST